jgi:hypothetical protein
MLSKLSRTSESLLRSNIRDYNAHLNHTALYQYGTGFHHMEYGSLRHQLSPYGIIWHRMALYGPIRQTQYRVDTQKVGKRGLRHSDNMIHGKRHFQSKYVQLVYLLHTSRASLEDTTSLVILLKE